MRMLVLVLACGASLLLAAPPTVDAQSRKAPTAQVEVSKRATSLPGPRYAWVPMPAQLEAEFDRRAQDPNLRTRLQAALDKALQAKGYRRSNDLRQADVAVAYRVGVRDVQQATMRDTKGPSAANASALECTRDGCSQIVVQSANGTPKIRVDTVDSVEGGLMVEVLQPNDIRVLWRSLYRGSVRAGKAGKIDLDAVARQTLAELPRAP